MSEIEQTGTGAQYLVSGVRPVTLQQRLELIRDLSLQPRARQKPCNVGLFEEDARRQMELAFD